MNAKQLQRLLDMDSPPAMLAAAKSYLRGDVLHDPIAAEAWLLRAVAAEDAKISPRAMGLLATRLWQIEEPLSDADYLDMCRRLQQTQGEERRTLLELLKLASERQKNFLH